ncbi:MAG: DUF1844 domain-containing protein [Bdellovibrionales bacterium]|nr:DUF1844 domain-containing protein [Bdellovibrionales bacterium]
MDQKDSAKTSDEIQNKDLAKEIPNHILTPSLSTLVLSIASSAAMALGIAPNPQTQKMEKNIENAKFHIDLLILLREKTRNNLEEDEEKFLTSIINDLQVKYIQSK